MTKPVIIVAAGTLAFCGCATSTHRDAVRSAPPPTNETASPHIARPPTERATVLTPFEGVVVRLDPPVVELSAEACLDAGWLEQIACAPGSREHESLLVVQAKPSQIHASLLMAGFESGSPGSWRFEEPDGYSFVAPTGAQVDLFVRYLDDSGFPREESIRTWIRDHLGRHDFPSLPWIFGGSMFANNPEWMEPGEHYVADVTGSIIGLVTFGDEIVGFSEVLADQEAVRAPEWEVNSDHVPPMGTEVTLILRRYRETGEADSN